MKERLLYGSGIRYRISSSDKMNTHVGVGIMQEDEAYDIKDGQSMSLLRSTNYITWKIKLSENTQIGNTAYFQFDTKQLRTIALYDGDLSIAINESLSFNFTINYRRDSEPHESRKHLHSIEERSRVYFLILGGFYKLKRNNFYFAMKVLFSHLILH